jgi:hypothetical protein
MLKKAHTSLRRLGLISEKLNIEIDGISDTLII